MTINDLNRVVSPVSIDFKMEDGAKVTVFSTPNISNIHSLISLILKYVLVDVRWC